MQSHRNIFRIFAAFTALGLGGCQLVLPDGGGGSGSTTSGSSTQSSSSTGGPTDCTGACSKPATAKCDTTFPCENACSALGVDAINCAEKGSMTCSKNLANNCKLDCNQYTNVCGINQVDCKNNSCTGEWLVEALRRKSTCPHLFMNACNSTDKSCAELMVFQNSPCN